jgi:exopolyphosphatase/pppGpp-phosphohydrolase
MTTQQNTAQGNQGQAQAEGARRNLPMDGVSILQRWLDLNRISIKRLAKHSGYSKEYIKRILDRSIPINRNFAIAASGATGILVKFLMETNPYPYEKPEPAQPEFDEDWGEIARIPTIDSAAAELLEEE